jgi:cell filamentation protein
MAGDPYVYPGTDVLKNRLGIRDAGALRTFEYGATIARALTAPYFPLTALGYKTAHRHLFGALYDWAGQSRTVDMSKGETVFARAAYIDASLQECFDNLAKAGFLHGMAPAAFAAASAHHISEINAIHPFREGNGRGMRLHLKQLAAQAGYQLDINDIAGPVWMQSSIAAFNGDEGPLARLIGNVIGLNREQVGAPGPLFRHRTPPT